MSEIAHGLDAINLLLIVVSLTSSFLGFILVFHGGGSRVSTAYAWNVVAILLWMLSMFFYRNAAAVVPIHAWVELLYVSATVIASSFLYFTHFFPVVEKVDLMKRALWVFVPNVVMAWFIATGDSIIVTVTPNLPGEPIIKFGFAYSLYVAYILSFFIFGYVRLIRKYVAQKDANQRNQIKYLLIGYVVASNIAFMSNLLLPWFGIFALNWLGQVSGLVMVAFAAYAIFKYRLFNVKVIATETLVFALWAFILIRTLFSETATDQLANLGLFLVAVIFGIFLVKSVSREVRQKEEIEKLALNLERANESLRLLDKSKSEFISLATHQIRSPLTAIKGYTSLILEGDYGEVSPQVRDVIKIVFDSCQNLVVIVNEFLDISRIELGRMKYDKSTFDFRALVKETIDELMPNVRQAGLTIEFHSDDVPGYDVYADKNKTEQVVSNLIDNAIKYTKQGGITLAMTRGDGKVLLTVKDTGVGIDPAEKGKLFGKFTRASDANKVNVIGTGLGLYIAKQMIEAQGGKIWVDSEGKGKGTTFYVELLEFEK